MNSFVSEVKLMSKFQNCDRIVKILGASLQQVLRVTNTVAMVAVVLFPRSLSAVCLEGRSDGR